jgi:hypothetical protein
MSKKKHKGRRQEPTPEVEEEQTPRVHAPSRMRQFDRIAENIPVRDSRTPTAEEFEEGRAILEELEAQDEERRKPPSKALPKMSQSDILDILRRG